MLIQSPCFINEVATCNLKEIILGDHIYETGLDFGSSACCMLS